MTAVERKKLERISRVLEEAVLRLGRCDRCMGEGQRAEAMKNFDEGKIQVAKASLSIDQLLQ